MRRHLLPAALLALLACEAAKEAAQEASADAGRALQDAGRWLTDAGRGSDAQAQLPADLETRHGTASCSPSESGAEGVVSFDGKVLGAVASACDADGNCHATLPRYRDGAVTVTCTPTDVTVDVVAWFSR